LVQCGLVSLRESRWSIGTVQTNATGNATASSFTPCWKKASTSPRHNSKRPSSASRTQMSSLKGRWPPQGKVFSHKKGTKTTKMIHLISLCFLCLLCLTRQIDTDLRPLPGLVGDATPPAMLLHNLLHDRQAEPCAALLR